MALPPSLASAVAGVGRHAGILEILSAANPEPDVTGPGGVVLCHKNDLRYRSAAGVATFPAVYSGPIMVTLAVDAVWHHIQGTVPGGSSGCTAPGQRYAANVTITDEPDLDRLSCTLVGDYSRTLRMHTVSLSGTSNVPFAELTLTGETLSLLPARIDSHVPAGALVAWEFVAR